MRRKVRPARLVAAVVGGGAVVLVVLVAWVVSVAPSIGALVLGIYMAVWGSAVVIAVAVAVIAHAAARKRHGVFAHLRQDETADVRGGRTRVRR